MPAPDLLGDFRRAWNVSALIPESGDQSACVAQWIVEAHEVHPAWGFYVVSVIHLRPLAGQAHEPVKTYDEAAYEFILAAMNPDGLPGHPFSVADKESWTWLLPVNFTRQFDGPDDRGAALIAEAAANAIVQGALNPEPEGVDGALADWDDALTVAILRNSDTA